MSPKLTPQSLLISLSAVTIILHPSAATPAFVVNLLTPSFITDSKFLSFSYDASQIKGIDNFGFFQSSRVDALISGLSPAYFRFSGTDIDYMLFSEDGACDNSITNTMIGFKGCLNSTQVTELLNITTRTNTSLVFGINGFIGKSSTSPNAPWNNTNCVVFFDWLQKTLENNPELNAPVAYELGNEPDLWPQRAQGEVLASDLSIFRNLLSQYPLIISDAFHIGPDPCFCYNGEDILHNYSKALSPSLISSSRLHISWHFYNNPHQPAPLGMVNSSAGADVLIGKINSARANIAKSGNDAAINAPLVIGETGECASGGCHVNNGTHDILYSEEFIDSYLRLDKIGLSAAMNVSVVMMEKIFGGNDGFINPLGFPLGPYWVHWLHKQLVGQQVLQVVNSTNIGRSLRLYAQCARQYTENSDFNYKVPAYPLGAIVLMIVNFDMNNSATINLEDSTGTEISLTPRDEYRLTGSMPEGFPNDDPSCIFVGPQPHKLMYLPPPVCVNGQLLYLSDGPRGFNTSMPTVTPVIVTDPTQPLQIPPLGLGYFVLPKAEAKACM